MVKELDILADAHSIIIEGNSKVGKMTFLLYLTRLYDDENVLILTPQEGYLFKRRFKALVEQFPQFSKMDERFRFLFLIRNFHVEKQKYGLDFFLQETLRILSESKEKILVFHRIEDFFEFQDRHFIEIFYKTMTLLNG